MKAIQVTELIGHGEKGEEEGAHSRSSPDFWLEKMSSWLYLSLNSKDGAVSWGKEFLLFGYAEL